jgi:3-isopropylmalate/(R)-2-methylmalate dehydratase small subunit
MPSFADIFASNAVGNGLLPAIAADADVRALLTMLADGAVEVTVDLGACEIISPAGVFYFTTDSFWREKLLNGWDDVDLTRAHQSEIDTFVATDRATRAWAWRDLG